MKIYKKLDFLNCEGYRVSNDGIIESCWHQQGRTLELSNNWKILKPTKNHYGYLQVTLRINNKRKSCYIHRLVALAFIENPYNYSLVCHINDNKEDNRLENLRWGTNKDNFEDSVRNNTYRKDKSLGSKNGKSKLNENDVIEIKRLLSLSVSQTKIAKQFDVTKSCISAINKKIKWKHV